MIVDKLAGSLERHSPAVNLAVSDPHEQDPQTSATSEMAAEIFIYGLCAGTTSAAATHFLDVGKVARHIGCSQLSSDSLLRFWFRGMTAGVLSQSLRFGTTIYGDTYLQAQLMRLSSSNVESNSPRSLYQFAASFSMSMIASGVGEVIANPPVAVKNYQIAHSVGPCKAYKQILSSSGYFGLFRGVSAGVLRKSVSNGIVLQSIGPVRSCLESNYFHISFDGTSGRAAAGLLAGGLVGGLAEILTNPLDRAKSLIQASPGLGLRSALITAVREPLRGAAFACARKALIRAINWGVLGALTSGITEPTNTHNSNCQTVSF